MCFILVVHVAVLSDKECQHDTDDTDVVIKVTCAFMSQSGRFVLPHFVFLCSNMMQKPSFPPLKCIKQILTFGSS